MDNLVKVEFFIKILKLVCTRILNGCNLYGRDLGATMTYHDYQNVDEGPFRICELKALLNSYRLEENFHFITTTTGIICCVHYYVMFYAIRISLRLH